MPHPPLLARLSLACLCAALVLPFLIPHHFNPIPSFIQEWTAAMFGLLAACVLTHRHLIEDIEIPEIALIPLGLIGLLLLQYFTGLAQSITQALLAALYLLWSLLMLTAASNLRRVVRPETIARCAAIAILFGAVFSAAIQALQFAGYGFGSGLISPLARGSGNLGQPNHLADYLWLGIASALFLHAEKRIGWTLFIATATGLATSSTLTGSRSTLLYAFGLTVLSLWSAWRFKTPALRRTAVAAAAILALTVLLQFALAHSEVATTINASFSGERLFREAGTPSQRLQLWRTGLAIFADHPWLGAGIGHFPYASYITAANQPGIYLGGGEHAHNLIIQLLSEFGILATLFVCVLVWRWWRAFIRTEWTAMQWWVAALLLVIGTHSQLEYPLWYVFFLGIASLALGLGSQAGMHPEISRHGRWVILLGLSFGAMTLASLIVDYRDLENTLYARTVNDTGQPASSRTRLDALARLHRESLLAHYVPLSYAHQIEVNREALPDKITVCEMAIRFSPVDLVTFKLAWLLALDDRKADARSALHRAIATHPAYATTAAKELDQLVRQFPEIGWLKTELSRLMQQN